jgi:hypothetical protein
MAKKQTRRSISVSRTTYERLKAFCEANNVSMSQLVETRVNDFLAGEPEPTVVPTRPLAPAPIAPRPVASTSMSSVPSSAPSALAAPVAPSPVKQQAAPAPSAVPMTSAAARFVVEPPPPIIKTKPQESAPKPAEKRPDQIFTF